MATAITASDYYFSTSAFRTTIDGILSSHGVIDTQLAGHLYDVIYKQHTDKLDLAAAASAV